MTAIIRMQLWAQDHRPVLLSMALVAALMELAFGCSDNGGMYQGGNDDAPRYR